MPFYHSFFHFCLQSLVFTTRWVHSLILINNFKPGIFQQKRTFFCNVVSNVSNQSTFSTSIIIAMCLLSKVSQFCQNMIRWNYPKIVAIEIVAQHFFFFAFFLLNFRFHLTERQSFKWSAIKLYILGSCRRTWSHSRSTNHAWIIENSCRKNGFSPCQGYQNMWVSVKVTFQK